MYGKGETRIVLRALPEARYRGALDAYEKAARLDFETVVPGFRNHDSRLRSTRGRALTE